MFRIRNLMDVVYQISRFWLKPTANQGSIREEQGLRSKIPRLSSIDDKVSQLVRNQYEENPYPRWINTGLSDNPSPISQVLQTNKLHLDFEMQQFSNNPDILIAGCGTGQHALGTASRFLNCNVLARHWISNPITIVFLYEILILFGVRFSSRRTGRSIGFARRGPAKFKCT